MGEAHSLDELSSKRDRRSSVAHLLDSSSSKWERARSLGKQIKAMIVKAIFIFLAPRYLKKESRYWKYVKSAGDTCRKKSC